MEYIQDLLNLVQDYTILSLIVAFFSTFIESFIPMLPLVAIVTANAALFGMVNGLLISWAGSVIGTICFFIVISKLSENRLYKKIKSEKIDNVISWIDKRGFKLLFIAYACPFLPACAITIASALSKRKFTTFVSAVISGKFIMFLVASYIGHDIYGFITSPIKILSLSLVIFIAWKIGNILNKDLVYIEEKKKAKKENIKESINDMTSMIELNTKKAYENQ